MPAGQSAPGSPSERKTRGSRFGEWHSTATHHSPVEDAQGIVTAVVLAGLGITMLQTLGFLTSGVAGLALVVSYGLGINVGVALVAINLPFFVLAWRALGVAFMAKTLLAVGLLALFTAWQPFFVAFSLLDPLAGSAMAGLLLGYALLALFRHRASLGGAGILAIYLQERFEWRAGLTQLSIDCVIFAAATMVVDPASVAYSLLGAVMLNGFLAINHRTDRYIAR